MGGRISRRRRNDTRPWGLILCVFLLGLGACGDPTPDGSGPSSADDGESAGVRLSNIEVAEYYFLGDLKARSLKATAKSSDPSDAAVRIGARTLTEGDASPVADVTVLFDAQPDATRSVVLALPIPSAPALIEVTFKYLDSSFRERAEVTRRLGADGAVEPEPR